MPDTGDETAPQDPNVADENEGQVIWTFTSPEMTWYYTHKDDKLLAEKMVEKTEQETGKPLSEEEKERIWKLVVGSATS